MTRLIPLAEIPHSGRAAESAARKTYADRADALSAAEYEIVVAEGCYSGAYAPTYGWVLTAAAARAVTGQVTRMPGGTCHRGLACYGLRDVAS